ncbi:ScbR family autoregulator-binding transcription factor [Streptomyces iconiensis]|uniref:ScbR family autoregulator-binding transcription factor n=1 Tax=Streptomyces iconiensis TaxID=1384038 RepID=A0ABT7A0X9_9ACTN|nr:ScbR family autoregulator-binding transcription factor [Streptomyces iconiensis]MDJ1134976.1 ScbR family autoregulator-binding transcription factor [Streptomyces iconiensis]
MAQQQRALLTRQLILSSAAEIFDEKGFDSASIAEILDRSEVTKGALYFHFPSKEALAQAILEKAVTTEGVPPQELKLQELVDIGLLLAHRLPREPVLSAALRLSTDRSARFRFGTRWPDWLQVSTGLLQEAREHGETLPGLDPGEVAYLLLCGWTGTRVVGEGMPDRGSRLTEDVAALHRIMLPGIALPELLPRIEVTVARAKRLHRTWVRKNAAATRS